MKITTILLLSACLTASAGGLAQRVTLSANNVKLGKIFKEIKKQTGYVFFYDARIMEDAKPVSIHVKNETVEEALKECLQGQPLDYSILRKTITIVPKENHDLTKSSLNVSIRNEDNLPSVPVSIINGTVKDAQGNPLAGVSVIVKGTNKGTSTSTNGSFSIEANMGDILEFSRVGYEMLNVKVNKDQDISIIMKVVAVQGEEVVVVGYGTQKKINLTGAISQVKGSDFIAERPVTSVGQALQGVIPGLTVNKSNGIPGDGYLYNIRGTTSLNGGSPLILVDGSEMDPNLIPPEDVESVSVLKDASAAIYGSRAAFGVILITTKSGKKNTKSTITYTGDVFISDPTILPEKVDPVTQIKVGGIQWENAGRTPGWYWGRNVQTWIDLYNDPNHVPNSDPLINGIAYPLGANNNMIKLMTESSLTTQHTLSISGGSEKTTYYLSAGLMSQNGILIGNKDTYSRKNILAKIDNEIKDWLSVGTTVGFTRGIQVMPYIPNNAGYMYDVSYLRPTFWLTGIDSVSGAPWGFSPEMVKLGAKNPDETDNTNIQLRTTIRPFKGFNIIGNYSYRRITQNDSYHVNTYEMANPPDGPGVTYQYRNNPNSLQKTATFNNYDNLSLYGEYNRLIADHDFKLMVGYSQEKSGISSYFAQKQQLISDAVPALDLAVGNATVGDAITEWATRSGFYRFNYNYKGKYLLEAVGRYDGSSRFDKTNRFIFSPSASIGWIVSDESFMNGVGSWLNFFKIRASYGGQGNQSVGAYSYLSSLNPSNANWILNGVLPLSLTPGRLISDSYTWEKVNSTNIGVDLRFFNNRLQVTGDVYKRETIGMLVPGQVLPSVLGTGVPTENAGNLKVNGWELSLNWQNRISKDFSYRAGLMLYDNKAVITKFANPTGILSSRNVGQTIGEIWGYETDRLFQDGDFIVNGNTRQYADKIPTQNFIFQNRVPFPGDVKYKDLNNDGVIDNGVNTLNDHGDLKIIGNSNPRYQFGIKLGATYKGFDLNIFLQGVAKEDLWTNGAFAFTAGSQYESIYKFTLDYWTPENTKAFYPRPDDRSYNKHTQSKYLLNAAYLRFKSLRIGYSIPKKIGSKIGLDKVKIYFDGENLFLISGLPKGLDPELGAQHTFPLAKDFSFGMTITL